MLRLQLYCCNALDVGFDLSMLIMILAMHSTSWSAHGFSAMTVLTSLSPQADGASVEERQRQQDLETSYDRVWGKGDKKRKATGAR